ncbi:DUF47 domain-containing protein [Leekyejoonella antrihumi]|uniref:DUF47 family protein n=1 Tax=Leekyejoonella antrihumi TaxID=1660198 RepID=A0A563DXD4_9MICO|nr:DUF47 family protein [Leekyejoonella antrihumi]TWP34593.1 DUF47 family protein [Leekyejoonella antrihumi]
MRLKPRDNRFYDLFTTAAGNTLDGAVLMEEFLSVPQADRERVADRIKEVEHAGDDTTHEIMQALNTSFITPFDREDIAHLAGQLDDVLDALDDAAELTVLYRVDELPEAVKKQASILKEAAALTVEVMPRLRTLKDLEEYWISINDLENQADTVYRSLLAELFNDGGDAVRIIKLKEVIDQLEAAADAFEHVADVVQTIALKES